MSALDWLLANAHARAGIEQKIFLTYVHFRFMHSTTLSGLNGILRSGPGYSLNRDTSGHLERWEIYTAKIGQNYF